MPFVILDKRNGMYIGDSSGARFKYTDNIRDAESFKTKGGALRSIESWDIAAREGDPYSAFRTTKRGKVPEYLKIIEVDVTELQEAKNPYDPKEYD